MCRAWDVKELLRIFPWELGPMRSLGCIKVFGNFKNAETDQQIGDRRAQNASEGKIQGPSQHLPSGVSLLQLSPKRYSEKLIGCVADRRGFYHQFWITDVRATRNCVFPFSLQPSCQSLRPIGFSCRSSARSRKPRERIVEIFLRGDPSVFW